MQLEKFEKIKNKLEVLKIESNYYSLNKVLHYFSYLGNIFLVYFGYFFIKSIIDTLPHLFPYQETFLSVFIALFLIGYELTKRFVLEQFTTNIIQVRRLTSSVVIGCVASLLLITGSFYLSINGAHRLVDNTSSIANNIENTTNLKLDSIASYYDKEIEYYRNQPIINRQDRRYTDSIVAKLQTEKDDKLNKTEVKVKNKSETSVEKNKENDTAFVFMTFFLEFIIILGVAFNSYYLVESYRETKKLLETPKYKKMQINLLLLGLYYQNGKKTAGNPCMSIVKLISLCKNQNIDCTQSDVKDFVVYCLELDIIKDNKNKTKQFNVEYDEAKKIIKKDIIL
jgi:hypothetical protein